MKRATLLAPVLMPVLIPVLVPALAAAAGPADHAVRLPVRTDGAGRLQVLRLPPAVYAAARTPDLSDLRVFDARGRAMPMARGPLPGSERSRLLLRPIPILGPAPGLTLRLDQVGGMIVARAGNTAAEGPGGTATLGVLLDARRFDGRAAALLLAADVPVGQPVTFVAEASGDLSSWRRLGERTVIGDGVGRGDDGGGGGADGAIAVPLNGAVLAGAYLRVTWHATNGRLLSPVRVERAALSGLARSKAADVEVCADPPPLVDARTLEFASPSSLPIAAVRITPAVDDALVPVRLLGRDAPEKPWTPIARGTASRGGPPVRLAGATYRAFRLEADAASPGFAAAPGLCFAFAPRTILFLVAGRAPYVLAAGREGAADAYLQAGDLQAAAPGSAGTATAGGAAPRLRLVRPDAGSARSATLLWAILLAATLLLAALVGLSWRRRSDPPSGD